MPKITISYRREDTGVITGRIFDRLEARYGRDAVFRDIDNIPLGIDFRKRINDVIERTDILLVVMGSQWLGPQQGQTLRINDESDPVRIEIETALSRQVPVIPVLIDNAIMPKTIDLPPSLAELPFRNAGQVDSMHHFDHDIDRLIRHIDNILSERKPVAAEIFLSSESSPTALLSALTDRTSTAGTEVGQRSRRLKLDRWLSNRQQLSDTDIKLNPFLRISGALGVEFRRRYNEENSSVAWVAVLIGTFLYLAFYFWDRVLDDTRSTETLTIRAIVSAVFFSLLVLPKPVFSRFLQSLMAFIVVVAGVGVVAIISIIKDGLSLGLSGVVLVLMFNFGFFRMLFVPSVISGVAICLVYNFAALERGLHFDLILANNFFLVSALCAGGAVTYLLERLFRIQFFTDKELHVERELIDALLANLLPSRIVQRLKAGETSIAESNSEATVLVCDLVGFTSLTKRLSAIHVVEILNDVFSIFDEMTAKYEVEKIKAIGDSYIVAAGVGTTRGNGAEAVAEFALEIESQTEKYAKAHGFPIALRAGVATGQVISGVIGLKKQSFDIWGETVDQARRLNSLSDQGIIQVNEATYWRLRDKYDFRLGSKIEIESVGKVQTHFLLRRKISLGSVAPSDGNVDQSTT
jgi:adenylate cyclase